VERGGGEQLCFTKIIEEKGGRLPKKKRGPKSIIVSTKEGEGGRVWKEGREAFLFLSSQPAKKGKRVGIKKREIPLPFPPEGKEGA